MTQDSARVERSLASAEVPASTRPHTGGDHPTAPLGDEETPEGLRLVARLTRLAGRRPLATIFVIAFACRAVVATAVTILRQGHLFNDDLMYSTIASQAAAHRTAHWDSYTRWLFHLDSTFLYPLTALYRVFGPHPIVAQLLVAAVGSLTAVLTARLAAEALPWRWAAVAGLIVALLPSQVLWSSLIMKDAFTWAAMVSAALLLAVAARSVNRHIPLLLLGCLVVVLSLLDHVRQHTFLVTSWALALTAWVGVRTFRWVRQAAVLAIALALPLLLGLGVAGTHLVHTYSGDPAERRATNAVGASTAVVKPPPTATSVGSATASPGSTASVSPTTPTSTSTSTSTAHVVQRNLAYLPRGLAVVLVEPFPWQAGSRSLLPAKAEAVLWWPLLLLALAGLGSLRRHARVLLFPLVVGTAIAGMWALTEGNFGTAYRHRGEVVWVVALLATFGLRTVVAWSRSRRGHTG